MKSSSTNEQKQIGGNKNERKGLFGNHNEN